jgi:hypothetical protein
VRRLDDHVHVAVLDRPVQYPHPEAPLGPRNRPYDNPIKPSTPKPKPSIDPKRHMHRHIVRKRLPRIVADAVTGSRPTGPFAAPPVPQPVEVKLRLPSASSRTLIGRTSGPSSPHDHVSRIPQILFLVEGKTLFCRGICTGEVHLRKAAFGSPTDAPLLRRDFPALTD